MCCDLTEIRGYNLKLYQRKKGYRFSIDSFLLAYFVATQKFENAFEIGAGNGIVSLLVERMTENSKHFELVEIQGGLCDLLKKNVEMNRPFKSEFIVRCEDAKYILPSKTPDIVYLNPPFTDFKKGKVSPNIEKAIAKHTYMLEFNQYIDWFMENTHGNSSLVIIESVYNLQKIINYLKKKELFLNKLVYVKPFDNCDPNLVLLFIIKKSRKTVFDEIVIYRKKGIYTEKVKKILGMV